MSQTSMNTLLAPVDEQAESKRIAEQKRWENWGRNLGTLTIEQITRSNNPQWQWDDYSI